MLSLVMVSLFASVLSGDSIDYEGKTLSREEFLKRCDNVSLKSAESLESKVGAAIKLTGTLQEGGSASGYVLRVDRKRGKGGISIPLRFTASDETLSVGRYLEVFGIVREAGTTSENEAERSVDEDDEPEKEPNGKDGIEVDVVAWRFEAPLIFASAEPVEEEPIAARNDIVTIGGYVENQSKQPADFCKVKIVVTRGKAQRTVDLKFKDLGPGERRPIEEIVTLPYRANVGSNVRANVEVSVPEVLPISTNDTDRSVQARDGKRGR